MAALTITKGSSTESTLIQKLFAKANHAYFVNGKQIVTAANDQSTLPATAYASLASGFTCDMALPIIEDSISFNTGDTDKTEVNILDGTTLVSRASKGDSDITAQIASADDDIISLFMTKGHTLAGVKFAPTSTEHTYAATGYSFDVKKVTGAIVLADDTEDVCLILTNVEMFGALVAAEGDNPAYINAQITPKNNVEGDALLILRKTA